VVPGEHRGFHERSDEALVEAIGNRPTAESDRLREVLFRRFYPRVAHWCLRFCGNPEDAGDLAQEIFLKVHQRLGSFRGESRFSTWLYAVSRNTALNWAARDRRRRERTDDGEPETFVDPSPNTESKAERDQIGAKLREAMQRDLEPLEAKILYLHHVDGLTLPRITALLNLQNRSGAKAYVVSATRKLRRKFGRWLGAQTAGDRERVGNDDLSETGR